MDNKKKYKLFSKASLFLYQKLYSLHKKKPQSVLYRLIYSKQVEENLKILHTEGSSEELLLRYYTDKLRILLFLCLAGGIITLCVIAGGLTSGELIEGRYIVRNLQGGGVKTMILLTDSKEEIPIVVQEQKYQEEELGLLLESFLGELALVVPGENESLNEVKQSLNLVTSLKGFPFVIEWECSDYTVLDGNGVIAEKQADEKGTLVKLTAVISYFDKEWEQSFFVRVLPKEPEEAERNRKLVEDTIKEYDRKTEFEEQLQLPEEIGGKKIIWKEKKETGGAALIALVLGAAAGIYFGYDRELQKRLKNRNQQMLLQYPEVVSKLILLMNAGMSVRAAWEKIVLDYQKKKKREGITSYVYEEMAVTLHELESGIWESKAYERFGSRCKLQRYIKFSALLTQNLKKGSAGIVQVFQEESKDAFEDRKSIARRMGEEAGTKLLLPMTLMLLIVMAVIIVPAFMSFSI